MFRAYVVLLRLYHRLLTTASIERKWTNGLSLAALFEGEYSEVTHNYAGKGVARCRGRGISIDNPTFPSE